jgi:hypothetical protein
MSLTMKQWSDLVDLSVSHANSSAQGAHAPRFFVFGPASAVAHPADTPGSWLSDALKAWCTDANNAHQS